MAPNNLGNMGFFGSHLGSLHRTRKTNGWNLKKAPAGRGKTSTDGQFLGSISILGCLMVLEVRFEIGKHRRPPLYS